MGNPPRQRADAFQSLGMDNLLLQLFFYGDIRVNGENGRRLVLRIAHQGQAGFHENRSTILAQLLEAAIPTPLG